MRILWVKLGGLWPINVGERIRSFHTISELSRLTRLTVLTTHEPGEDPRELAVRLPHCERILSVPHTVAKRESLGFALSLVGSWLTPYSVNLWRRRIPALRREISRMIANDEVDLIVADFLFAMPNIPRSRVPVVLFEHNVEYVIWKRMSEVDGRWWRHALLGLEWRKLRRYETRSATQAKLTLTVSDVDRALLAREAPAARLGAVPTGVDTAYFTPNGTAETPASLVFTGAMDWYPNEDAMLWFIDAILPLVRRQVPEVSVAIVGRNPTERLREMAGRAGVEVTGTVDDIRPWVARGAVYIVPLRVGGGTRLKIFEACAMGKAVVSTTVGAEGLPMAPGTHFLQADEPGDFAAAVVSLLRDRARRSAIGRAARALVEERCSWASIAREFEFRCKEVVSHAR